MEGLHKENTLLEVIDRILDKGIVINADITVSLVGVELLGIKLRAALASFETAAKFGLAFPSGTNLNTPSWKTIRENNEESTYPELEKEIFADNRTKKTKVKNESYN